MQPELWIFDLAGTIVDVRESSREAIRRTVQAYFGQVMGLRGATALVTHRDIQEFRLAGGFTNGWELSSALIGYLLSRMKIPPRRPENLDNLNDISDLLRRVGRRSNLTIEQLRSRADFERIAEATEAAGGGLEGLMQALGQPLHPLLFHSGDLRTVNVVQRLFQEFYLGRRNYATLHGSQPFYYKGPGLIENERLLIPREQLEALSQALDGKLAIATGSPVREIKLVLETHHIARLFRTVVGYEDIVAETARAERVGEPGSRAKPHPFILLEAAAALDPSGERRAVYIGDAPHDIVAAHRANEQRPFEGWGVLWSSFDRDRLQARLQAEGADRILDTPAALLPEMP